MPRKPHSPATAASPTTTERGASPGIGHVIDRPCPRCRQPSPHRLTDDLLSECFNCGARWL